MRFPVAKLYFRYGAVGSAKTLNLLAVSHNYRQQDKKILLLKPKLDDRFGSEDICSRAGLKAKADYFITKETCFYYKGEPLLKRPYFAPQERIDLDQHLDACCLLVDEAQFLSEGVIEDLHTITIKLNIPVIAYGLKVNFKGYLFEGSKRLMELSDRIEEVKTTCFYCPNKATHNLRLLDGSPVFGGEEIELGADEKYKAACKACFHQFKFKDELCSIVLSPKKSLEKNCE